MRGTRPGAASRRTNATRARRRRAVRCVVCLRRLKRRLCLRRLCAACGLRSVASQQFGLLVRVEALEEIKALALARHAKIAKRVVEHLADAKSLRRRRRPKERGQLVARDGL